ncbi:hypothetical protein [Sinomicrobium soli]|uniref:hypothetical protein n=1 Tax=Sinomicrobium sp. N-1-3-6 TaxID=2219864 RepID=UPI000DCB3994|nr:hypothetical protein [Sinomicrobium sp. N-1-3-6]RAV30543.1 hypothetical protein DN748_03335 [Sinomicrobium sp. N-1-3-6]
MRSVILPCVFIILLYPLVGSCDRKTCCDDPPETVVFDPPGGEDFRQLQQQVTDSLAETFVFNTGEGLDAATANGTRIRIFPDCLISPDGTIVDGEVRLEFMQCYDRSSTLLAGISSLARTDAGTTVLLNKGAFFSFRLYQEDTELFSNCEIQLSVPFSLIGAPDQELSLWNGDEMQNGTGLWLPVTGELFPENDAYTTIVPFGRWRAISGAAISSEAKDDIRVLVSEGYNGDNSRVYITYPNDSNGLVQCHYDRETGMFRAPYPVPDGQEAFLIFLSEEDGQWRYGIKEITISGNTMYTLAHSETQKAGSGALVSAVNDLP